jgi:hypothetical protein
MAGFEGVKTDFFYEESIRQKGRPLAEDGPFLFPATSISMPLLLVTSSLSIVFIFT